MATPRLQVVTTVTSTSHQPTEADLIDVVNRVRQPGHPPAEQLLKIPAVREQATGQWRTDQQNIEKAAAEVIAAMGGASISSQVLVEDEPPSVPSTPDPGYPAGLITFIVEEFGAADEAEARTLLGNPDFYAKIIEDWQAWHTEPVEIAVESAPEAPKAPVVALTPFAMRSSVTEVPNPAPTPVRAPAIEPIDPVVHLDAIREFRPDPDQTTVIEHLEQKHRLGKTKLPRFIALGRLYAMALWILMRSNQRKTEERQDPRLEPWVKKLTNVIAAVSEYMTEIYRFRPRGGQDIDPAIVEAVKAVLFSEPGDPEYIEMSLIHQGRDRVMDALRRHAQRKMQRQPAPTTRHQKPAPQKKATPASAPKPAKVVKAEAPKVPVLPVLEPEIEEIFLRLKLANTDKTKGIDALVYHAKQIAAKNSPTPVEKLTAAAQDVTDAADGHDRAGDKTAKEIDAMVVQADWFERAAKITDEAVAQVKPPAPPKKEPKIPFSQTSVGIVWGKEEKPAPKAEKKAKGKGGKQDKGSQRRGRNQR